VSRSPFSRLLAVRPWQLSGYFGASPSPMDCCYHRFVAGHQNASNWVSRYRPLANDFSRPKRFGKVKESVLQSE
jgi:hypothetical protein